MNPLTPSERSRIDQDLAEVSGKLLNTIEHLSARQLAFRPRDDRWSIAENVEHLSTVDHLVLGQIFELVDAGGPVKVSSWVGRDEALLEQVRRPEPPIKAPEIIAPRGTADPKEILTQFRLGCQRLSAFAATTDAPLRSYCFPHPIFGELDCYQWLLCAAAHYERHLTQIRGVMAMPDFPDVAGSTECASDVRALSL